MIVYEDTQDGGQRNVGYENAETWNDIMDNFLNETFYV